MSRLVQKLLKLALAAGALAPLAGVLSPRPLHADVIFSNLDGAPDGLSFLQVGGPLDVSEAEAFIPAENYSMTGAQIVLDAGAVDLFLYSDNSGAPGSEIEQLATNVSGPSGSYALETANSFTPISLTAGTEYWLVLTPFNSTSSAFWGDNASIYVPWASSTDGGATWTSLNFDAQFEIDGTPLASTPEPSELPLLSIAAIGLLIAMRRKGRKA